MTTHLEFFREDGGFPMWALRWSVESFEATVEVTNATRAVYNDGREVDEAMSDGGAGDDMPLDGPWRPHFTVAVKFDGSARMWAEDLQLGTANGIADLVPLFDHIYSKAAELLKVAREAYYAERRRNEIDAAQRIADSQARVAARHRRA